MIIYKNLITPFDRKRIIRSINRDNVFDKKRTEKLNDI